MAFTVTKDRLLPTTVTGSWPRPSWYTASARGQRFSDAARVAPFREQFFDAVATVLCDQARAGLDILTNGDYHQFNSEASVAAISKTINLHFRVVSEHTEITALFAMGGALLLIIGAALSLMWFGRVV